MSRAAAWLTVRSSDAGFLCLPVACMLPTSVPNWSCAELTDCTICTVADLRQEKGKESEGTGKERMRYAETLGGFVK